ncbi:MAG TPA: hypothetical protein VLL05_09015, partial [Terriglobales bacterium]|nr:hypothetical protein [Terriglobales bacterium]
GSTSNDRFKHASTSNFPLGGPAYFAAPPPCSSTVTTNCYTTFTGTDFGNANPPVPGIQRNSLNGPGYKDVDLTLTKAFGLPKVPVLGESAKVEFRVDAYNVFNNLNFKTSDPNDIANNISDSSFGRARTALAGRVVTLGARFNF